MASRRKQSKPKAFGLNESELGSESAETNDTSSAQVESLNKIESNSTHIKKDQIINNQDEQPLANVIDIPVEKSVIQNDFTESDANFINERKRKRPSQDDEEIFNGDGYQIGSSSSAKNPNLETVSNLVERQETSEKNNVNILFT
jgi:hypothetical protein